MSSYKGTGHKKKKVGNRFNPNDLRDIPDKVVEKFMSLPICDELVDRFRENGIQAFQKEDNGEFVLNNWFAVCIYLYNKLADPKLTMEDLLSIAAPLIQQMEGNDVSIEESNEDNEL